MQKHKFTFTIPAKSQAEAEQKAAALAKLASQFDGKTLAALAGKAKGFFRHPIYGATIRKELGI